MEIDHQFVTSLRRLAVRVRGADPALQGLAYFLTPTDAEMVKMRRSVLELLAEADSSAEHLLQDLLPRLEETPLDDLAMIVAQEVRQERAAILRTGSESSTTWEVGIAAVQALSKILKAATALENAYCNELGIPSEVSHVAETETAVEIRQVYAKFWRSVDAQTPQTPEETEQRLRSASTAIARLRGRPVFFDLRALDRRLLLSLQRRIREWLVSGGETEPGLRLWQDLLAFAELLQLINHRMELVQLDAMLIPELMSSLAEMESASRPLVGEPNLLERMKLLSGRSLELDRLINDPDSAEARQLFEVMSQMEIEMITRMSMPDKT